MDSRWRGRGAWKRAGRRRAVRRLAAILAVAPLFPPVLAAQVKRDFDAERLGELFVLLRGATVIDGSGGLPRENASVLIRNGIIEEVGAADDVLPPDGAQVVDISGRYLLPGFVDVRVYPRDTAVVEALLAAGITAARSTDTPIREGVDYRQLSNAGRLRGPRIYSSGPVLDFPPGYWPGATLVSTEDEVRKAVDEQVKAGFDFIQLYIRLPPALVAAAAREAHRQGVKVIADVVATSWTDAARANVDFLSHVVSRHPALLSEPARKRYEEDVAAHRAHPYYRWLELLDLDGPEVDRMVGALLMRDVMVDPDLALIESVLFCSDSTYQANVEHLRSAGVREVKGPLTGAEWGPEGPGGPGLGTADQDQKEAEKCPADSWPADFVDRARAAWPKALALVKLLYDQGVRLAAGSGAPLGKYPPGVSFHRELELLSAAGIPNRQVLRIATSNGAVALGILHRTGSIEPGKRADLVLLRSDPLESIRNTRSIEWVMRRGKVFKPTQPVP
ncbi:MAG: amidohydrolase family protein [Gemmatimonadota bacterium]